MQFAIKFTLFFSIVLFSLSLATNPPQGSSGAPFDRTCSRGGCHFGGSSISGEIKLLGIPEKVQEGATYDIEVVLKSLRGDPRRAGFQLVAVGADEQDSGTFSSIDSSTTLSNFLGRTYFEHQPAKWFDDLDSIVYTASWTAPMDNLETKFYISGLFANGNNAPTSDFYISDSLIVNNSEGQTTSIASLNLQSHIKLYPNPVWNNLMLDLRNLSFQRSSCKIVDLAGKVLNEYPKLAEINNFDLQDLNQGVYLIYLRLDKEDVVLKFCKM